MCVLNVTAYTMPSHFGILTRDQNKRQFLQRIASVWTPLIYKTNFHRPKYKYNKLKNFQ